MKKIILLASICLFAITTFANKKTPAEKAKAKAEEMTKDLQLNAEQAKKIYEITLKANVAIDDYEAKKPSKKLKKKQKDIVQDMRNAEYKKVLTAAQFKKYQELKKKEKAQEKKEKDELEKLKK